MIDYNKRFESVLTSLKELYNQKLVPPDIHFNIIKNEWKDRMIKFGDYDDIMKEVKREGMILYNRDQIEIEESISLRKKEISEIFNDYLKEKNIDDSDDLSEFITTKIIDSIQNKARINSFDKYIEEILIVVEFKNASKNKTS